MKIHILGASGSGVTTLGKLLAAETNTPYFDSDDYFREKPEAQSSTIRDDENKKNKNFHQSLRKCSDWILGGAIIPWEDDLMHDVDLVIFLWLPREVRLERLKQRELKRYGNVILTDPATNLKYKTFLDGAAGYDNPSSKGNTLAAHERWLKRMSCHVLELRGDMSIHEKLDACVREINKTDKYHPLDSSEF